jgi:hypothetical protein
MQPQAAVAVKVLEFNMIVIILALFAHDNQEFFALSHAQQQEGYQWEMIDEGCRPPGEGTLALIDGDGNVCWQLEKPTE